MAALAVIGSWGRTERRSSGLSRWHQFQNISVALVLPVVSIRCLQSSGSRDSSRGQASGERPARQDWVPFLASAMAPLWPFILAAASGESSGDLTGRVLTLRNYRQCFLLVPCGSLICHGPVLCSSMETLLLQLQTRAHTGPHGQAFPQSERGLWVPCLQNLCCPRTPLSAAVSTERVGPSFSDWLLCLKRTFLLSKTVLASS